MWKLAWRNLVHERTRLIMGVAGVALAVLLIVLINGVFVGAETSMVNYIVRQPARLWLMQAGVENMHMAYSMLPPGLVERVKQIPGVQEAAGVLYVAANVEVSDTLVPSYIFGVEPGQPLGGPWQLAEGRAMPGLTEAVVDQALARRYGLSLGNSINIRGFELTIIGLSEETFGFGSNIVFVNKVAMALGMGVSPQAASYILIRPAPDTDAVELAGRLRSVIPEANLVTQEDSAASDMNLARQMGSDVIRVMNILAFIVGLLVIGISVYSLTLERIREYGVLKAIGARPQQLFTVVIAQAYTCAAIGFIIGLILALGAARMLVDLTMTSVLIAPSDVLRQLPVLVLVATLAALLPIARVLRLDAMLVFRA
ncbi:MAG: ABC transporter permease [Anaerolineae bacterium]|nr:ABC transporter permease [Anaerolineae bacterium]